MIEENQKLATEDQLYRSFGVLANARSMSSQEAMELLSDLKLGVDLGSFKMLILIFLSSCLSKSDRLISKR